MSRQSGKTNLESKNSSHFRETEIVSEILVFTTEYHRLLWAGAVVSLKLRGEPPQ